MIKVGIFGLLFCMKEDENYGVVLLVKTYSLIYLWIIIPSAWIIFSTFFCGSNEV